MNKIGLSARPTLELVDDFIERKVRERGEAMDRTGEFDRDLLDEAASLGLTGMLFDDSLKPDLSSMPLAHDMAERLAAVCAPLAMQIGVLRIVGYLLARYATQDVQDRWLKSTTEGKTYGSFALTEPHAGTDLRSLSTVAVRSGDTYLVNGRKCWVGFAPCAAYAIVLCKEGSAARDAKTLALVVDMESPGARGVWGPELSGFRGMPNGELFFENVTVPVENALRVEGFDGMMDGLNMARIEAAAYACGLLRGALEEAVYRASTRKAFGGKIADLPSIQMKLGRMRAAYHTARELTLKACRSYMEGRGGDQDLISIAKMTASDLARLHTDEAMQIFGAAGVTLHSRVERLHRDSKATQIFDGTSEIHETMVGRRLVSAFERHSGKDFIDQLA
ncbi:acyl-CoA dehydrogenase family protein [Arthrobacter sp. NPDC080031]|uniref:acyl-CoA dehydrogenase family protein n=1 Tax=Arthrobacter sp. NPDC080031 TaxID=3155918 RepID=UPI00344C8C47